MCVCVCRGGGGVTWSLAGQFAVEAGQADSKGLQGTHGVVIVQSEEPCVCVCVCVGVGGYVTWSLAGQFAVEAGQADSKGLQGTHGVVIVQSEDVLRHATKLHHDVVRWKHTITTTEQNLNINTLTLNVESYMWYDFDLIYY